MSPLARQAIKLFGKLHKVLYSMTGSRVFANLGRMPNLLLTATGSKSGKPRTVPLLYVETDDGYAIVASFGGSPEHPAWYRNLLKHPQATVQIEDRIIPVTATTATSEQKKELWPRLVAMYPDYDNYEAETERDIPVVLLQLVSTT
jgi:deazaflavin-dependent oxidoreductase (nitroreductase family)